MQDIDSPHKCFRNSTKQDLKIGFHKAFQIAKQVSEYRIILVSENDRCLNAAFNVGASRFFAKGFRANFSCLPKDAKIALLPYATSLDRRISPYGSRMIHPELDGNLFTCLQAGKAYCCCMDLPRQR
jgi:hypothetical protein